MPDRQMTQIYADWTQQPDPPECNREIRRPRGRELYPGGKAEVHNKGWLDCHFAAGGCRNPWQTLTN